MSHVPPEAVNYIATALHPSNPAPLRSRLQGAGLSSLMVRDLKILLRNMERFQFAHRRGHLSTPTRKQEMIDRIRFLIYLDHPLCSQPDPDAIRELVSARNHSPAQTQSTTARASAVAVARNHQTLPVGQHLPHGMFPGTLFPAPPAVLALPPHLQMHLLSHQMTQQWHGIMPQHHLQQNTNNNAAHAQSATSRVKQDPDMSANSQSALAQRQSNSSPCASSAASDTISTLSTADGATQPPNSSLENSIVSQLMSVGFTDREEILSAIRRIAQAQDQGTGAARALSSSPLTVDAVMISIVSQREEAEEAHRMDYARVLSEQSRKEETRRRQKIVQAQKEEQQRNASWNDWLQQSDMFPKSWLLQQAPVRNALEDKIKGEKNGLVVKQAFLNLLRLEQKSLKWYGNALPRAFFRTIVADRLGQLKGTNGEIARALDAECKELEFQMYTLAEQIGGRPKIFLDALDAAVDDNADDVVVIKTSSHMSLSNKNTSPGGDSLGGKSAGGDGTITAPDEVIEIF